MMEEIGLRINPLGKMQEWKIFEVHHPYAEKKLRHLVAFFVSEPSENPDEFRINCPKEIKSCKWMTIDEIQRNIREDNFVENHAKSFRFFMNLEMPIYTCYAPNCPLSHGALQPV